MRPTNSSDPQDNLFQSRLEQIINFNHPLVKLSRQIDWSGLDKKFGELYVEGFGRPGLATRLMVGLHYLKYAYDESDESVVARFLENPYWQYFCGFDFFQHEFPLDPTSLVKWRQRVGEGGAESLLQKTIEAAMGQELLSSRDVDRVTVDTTVQEKGVAFPTDAGLYEKARVVLVREAKKRGIKLRQSYSRVGKKALHRQSRYRHARQMKRAKRQTRKLRTYLGRVIRDIRRKCSEVDGALEEHLAIAGRIYHQGRHDKNKVYSMFAPEVECIAKGKTHKKYEFGCKVSFVSTSKNNWIIGAQAFHGNPYDGHTLDRSLKQSERLTGRTCREVYCDRGYRGAKVEGCHDYHLHLAGRKGKGLTRTERKWLKRRSAIEPIIGHLKGDHRLSRNHLQGKVGDGINAILAACGFNIKKLLRAFLCLILRRPKIVQNPWINRIRDQALLLTTP
jgi:IS5 family transposase